MKGHLRAMLYTLCLAVLIVIEATTMADLEGYCNCSDWTTERKTTATSPTTTIIKTTTPKTSSMTASLTTATSQKTTTLTKTSPTTTSPTKFPPTTATLTATTPTTIPPTTTTLIATKSTTSKLTTSSTTATPTTIPPTTTTPEATSLTTTAIPNTTTPTTTTQTTTAPTTTTPTTTTQAKSTPIATTSPTAKPTTSSTTITPTATTPTKTTPTTTTPIATISTTAKPTTSSTTTTPTTTTPTTTTPTTTTPTTTTTKTTTPTTTTPTTTTPTTTTPTTTTPTTTTPTTTTTKTTTPTTTSPTTTTPTTTTTKTTTTITTSPTTTKPTTVTTTTATSTIKTPTATSISPSYRKRKLGFSNSKMTSLSVKTGTRKTTNNTVINCIEVCSKHEDSYTSTLPTTPLVSVKSPAKPHPTQYPFHEVNLDHRTFSIPLRVFVNGNFSDELKNSTTTTYSNYSKPLNESLTNLYVNITGFSSVEILGFFPGSIGCKFSVHVTPRSSFNISKCISSLRNAHYSNSPLNVGDNSNLTVQQDKTFSAIENDTAELLEKPCEVWHVNCSYDEFCLSDQGVLFCSHKCNTHDKCSKDGICYVDTIGNVACRCREDSTYVYKGDICNEKVLVFFTRKNTAIIGACAGAVIACLLLLSIYLGARWRHKRMKKKTHEKLSDPEKVRKGNSQIGNVQMDDVGKTNPMYRPHKNNHQQEGHGNYYPGERSDRDNIYDDELAYDEGRYYRVLNDPESRSKALVYQPSSMSSQDTVPKFDDPHSKPLSPNRRQEIEHQPFHDMANTQQAYAIRRPQLMSNVVNSYGYR